METPETPAGRITGDLMSAIKADLPDMDTATYNKIYSAILTRLTEKTKPQVIEVSANAKQRRQVLNGFYPP